MTVHGTRRAVDRAVLSAGRTLVSRGLVVGSVGNVSARHGHELRITPTRTPYETMRRRDLVSVEIASGRPTNGKVPSRELPLHLAVYRTRPDVGAVIHTHSVAATAWSFLDRPLEPELEDLAYYGIDTIRTAAPAPPGSDQLARNVADALDESSAVLLGEHGVLAVGFTVADALTVAEVVEHQAQISWLTARVGCPAAEQRVTRTPYLAMQTSTRRVRKRTGLFASASTTRPFI